MHTKPQPMFAVLAMMLTLVACSAESYKQFVPLADSLELPANAWVEISAPEPLRTPAYDHQICFLPVAPTRLADDPMGLVDATGNQIAVQAEASGPDGKLDLQLSSYQGQHICFGVSDAELDLQFDSVRLRASLAIQIEGVEWQSTDK